MNRILWNRRDIDIDEIVVHDCTVHIEQMSERCWQIDIGLPNGMSWMGNFRADQLGRMTFSEQDSDIEWDRDQSHEEKMNPSEEGRPDR